MASCQRARVREENNFTCSVASSGTSVVPPSVAGVAWEVHAWIRKTGAAIERLEVFAGGRRIL